MVVVNHEIKMLVKLAAIFNHDRSVNSLDRREHRKRLMYEE